MISSPPYGYVRYSYHASHLYLPFWSKIPGRSGDKNASYYQTGSIPFIKLLVIHVMTMSRHLRFSSSRHIFFAGESPSQLTDIDVANRGLFVEGIHFCLVLIGPACDPMIMWSVQTSKRSFTTYIFEGRTLLASSAAAWKSSCESNDVRLGTMMSLRFLKT